MTVCMIGAAMAVSACAANGDDVDYSYERQAPYADERTATSMEAPAPVVETHKAERVFESAQRK
ncbi:MAG: hypothetical protein H6868_00455 [Rhodospirillales bacterium]|nr:hypothetical protein [Rhodospirillales bacterium]